MHILDVKVLNIINIIFLILKYVFKINYAKMCSFLKFEIKFEAKNNCFKSYNRIFCGLIVFNMFVFDNYS